MQVEEDDTPLGLVGVPLDEDPLPIATTDSEDDDADLDLDIDLDSQRIVCHIFGNGIYYLTFAEARKIMDFDFMRHPISITIVYQIINDHLRH